MRQRFADWYPEQIRTGLDNGLQLERIKVKIIFTMMKPLYAIWLIELFNTTKADQGQVVIISG